MFKDWRITVSVISLSISISLAGCGNQLGTDNKLVPTRGEEMSETMNITKESTSQERTIAYSPEEFHESSEDDIQDEKRDMVSDDELAIREIARSFAEAYLKGKAEEIKPYLSEEVSDRSDVHNKNAFDDLDLFILKADLSDIEEKERIEVQYQYNEKGADSSDYLGMVFSKKSGEWKIIDYFVEK